MSADDIRGITPKAVIPGASTEVSSGNLISITAPGELVVQILGASTIGFYAETTPRRALDETAKALEELVGQFKAGLPDDTSFLLDFLFDPDRQRDFDAAGSLSSKTIDQAVQGSELDAARRWLRGER